MKESKSMTPRKSPKKRVLASAAAAGTSTARIEDADTSDTRGNGLQVFAIHSLDEKAAPVFARLRDERASNLAFVAAPAKLTSLDPETAAIRYLHQALRSDSVPSFTAPKVEGVQSEFKSLGTDTVPLTDTKVVKFRQTYNKIPVYGSLVSVELDNDNDLVSLNSAMGQPQDVSPIAKISPADALKAIAKFPGYRKQLGGLVPHLYFYFDNKESKWHLAFIVEDVPVAPTGTSKEKTRRAPLSMDYVVDAQSGSVVAELPRTPSFATGQESSIDGLGMKRQIGIEVNGKQKLLYDSQRNVQTFDFNFQDPQLQEKRLPGNEVKNPPSPWPSAAISAHANATAVAEFLRNVVKRNNIDNPGGPMNSSINCVVKRESRDGKQWFNAFWNGKQMVYGQRKNGTALMSLSVDLDVVGHEMFHGVTEFTARLEYVSQSGALNESYSDIFGVIIANLANPDVQTWKWEIGEGLSPTGKPFRNLKDPSLFGQPDNMKGYKKLPETEDGDWGGVHLNSGIHNRAAYLILSATDSAGHPALTPQEVAAVFYLALTQQLSRTSQFSDSRRGVLLAARTLFRTLPSAQQTERLGAIEKAFTAVGIL